MEIYFFVYIIAFLTMLWDRPSISKKTKKRLMTFNIVWLTCFFGFRWDCGTDWNQYYGIFEDVQWNNFYNLNRYGNQNVEIGFAFVNVLCKSLGTYTFYLLVSNAARFLCMAYASFKLSKYPIITFFGFQSIQYFFPTRNPFATAIFYLAFIFIVNKKFRNYIYTWVCACSIHISSIIVLPTYWLYGYRIKFIYQIIIYLSSILLEKVITQFIQTYAVVYSFGFATLSEKVETYSQAFREEGSRSLLQYAFPLFFLSLFEYVRKKGTFVNDQETKNFDFYVIVYLISLIIVTIFQNTMSDLTRYSEFFYTWPLLMPFVLKYFKKYRTIIIISIISYYIYRLNNSINYNYYRDLFIPYRSIFGVF